MLSSEYTGVSLQNVKLKVTVSTCWGLHYEALIKMLIVLLYTVDNLYLLIFFRKLEPSQTGRIS